MMAGVHLLPMLGSCAAGSFVAGAASSKRNNTSIILILASMLQIVGVGLLSSVTEPDSDVKAQYGYQTIFGFGSGLSLSASTIMASVESAIHGDLAAAQGAIAQVRVLGGCLGVSACTVVFNKHANKYLEMYLQPEQIQQLRHDLAQITSWPSALVDSVKTIYAEAFSAENRIMIYVCAAMIFCALFTWQRHPLTLQEALGVDRREQLETSPDSERGTDLNQARRQPRIRNFSRKATSGDHGLPLSCVEGGEVMAERDHDGHRHHHHHDCHHDSHHHHRHHHHRGQKGTESSDLNSIQSV